MIKLDNKDIALALVAIACGGYALLAASGVLPVQTANNTPVWITFHASSEGFSGGIPFLPNDMNVSLARVMFGLGALLCCSGFLYALKRFFGSHK